MGLDLNKKYIYISYLGTINSTVASPPNRTFFAVIARSHRAFIISQLAPELARDHAPRVVEAPRFECGEVRKRRRSGARPGGGVVVHRGGKGDFSPGRRQEVDHPAFGFFVGLPSEVDAAFHTAQLGGRLYGFGEACVHSAG